VKYWARGDVGVLFEHEDELVGFATYEVQRSPSFSEMEVSSGLYGLVSWSGLTLES